MYFLANGGEGYRNCLDIVASEPNLALEFIEFYGISAMDTAVLLDKRVLNEAILDVIVQNSKPKSVDFLF